ncbi:3-phosphoserine/phosphohydroxythreonine transaminase [Rossellomorea vietnamensis]|uniref:3-phosphoserine/phosphohydroxythreonine transaminase n=1 Tax=Rossellomorea vietnamensis TaxID=218284 RepID=UPI001E4708E4|nr:3-phosphoserine/phosphohydroxythreonine transaminase [Rossellomorea vietnamensis]MCC5802104.1 3-phosphoserine/phosphohydroxythreonine transaminase [Rossellomorea vietnamensis]
MKRVYNFSAGPAVLPEPVLKKVQNELLNYRETGMSVMELSHRSAPFQNIIEEAQGILRELLAIPDDYRVVFMQGGASLQFSMIPLNLLGEGQGADYIVTGSWSKKAFKEAEKVGDIRTLSLTEPFEIPAYTPEDFSPESSYVHITSNNTIEGTRFAQYPDTGGIPLVADMSSHILSEKIDVSSFGLIYAGAQKNLGPSGVTVAIIRDSLIGKAPDTCPTMLNYETYVKHDSLFNTPPTFSIYVLKLVLEWVKENGGVEGMQEHNERKAALLYNCIDESSLFRNPVTEKNRSLMNIPFSTGSDELDADFLKGAKAEGFEFLKGHRSVGGMRASLYNAMPLEGVKSLVDFMKKFESDRGGC